MASVTPLIPSPKVRQKSTPKYAVCSRYGHRENVTGLLTPLYLTGSSKRPMMDRSSPEAVRTTEKYGWTVTPSVSTSSRQFLPLSDCPADRFPRNRDISDKLRPVCSQSWNPCSAARQFQQPGLNGFRTRPRSSSTSRFRCSSTSSTCSAASKQGALDDRNTPTEVRPP